MAAKKFYWRCNGGHYFASLRCPFDGWSSDELLQLNDAAESVRTKEIDPSIAALLDHGVSESTVQRAIVVEFGSEQSVFDAISPDYFVIQGRSVKLREAGTSFH